MKRNISIVALAFYLILGSGEALAQQPGQDQRPPDAAGSSPPSGDPVAMESGANCGMMQKEKEKMEMGMHQAHEKLQGLMHDINATTGPAKMDAMAGAMNEMMGQMEQMHKKHMDMMSKMMEHMNEHMMQGSGPKAREDTMKCPMMTGHETGGKRGEHGARPAPGADDDHSPAHDPSARN